MQFLGLVEEGCGEVLRITCRISMLPVSQVALQDGREQGLLEEAVSQGVEKRGKPADRRRQDHAAGAKNPKGLLQAVNTVLALGEMVQRAKQQDGIHRAVLFFKVPCVSQPHAGERLLLS